MDKKLGWLLGLSLLVAVGAPFILLVWPLLPLWGWGISMFLTLVSILLAGGAINGDKWGALINEQNRISLSHLQIILWSTLILPAMSTTLATRLRYVYSPQVPVRAEGIVKEAIDGAAGAETALSAAQTASEQLKRASQDQRGVFASALASKIKEVATATDGSAQAARKALEALSMEKSPTSNLIQDALNAGDASGRAAKAARYAVQIGTIDTTPFDVATQRLLMEANVTAANSATNAEFYERGTKTMGAVPGILAAFNFNIPAELWALMGISLGSAVGSVLILRERKNENPSPGAHDAAEARLTQLNPAMNPNFAGAVWQRSSPSNASFSDLFRGEFLANAGQFDISRAQNLYLTLFAVTGYAFVLGTLFSEQRLIPGLPEIPAGLVTLIGISHAGYLGAKALSGAGQNPAPGGGGSGGNMRAMEPEPSPPPQAVALRGTTPARVMARGKNPATDGLDAEAEAEE